ncbi:MAG: sulfurtransferase complex subunit TusD [Acinetobacter sp.]|nr:sulfurtransferase complex subunit TusD [Acinetobacter sp.]
MHDKITLLLITTAPTHKMMWHAVRLAHALQQQQRPVKVFFYQDAVSIANALTWQPDDQCNLQQQWQQLGIDLPVCVSAALGRGICDAENAQRHGLNQHCSQSNGSPSNLAQGFRLVGLGELADAMTQAHRVLQF